MIEVHVNRCPACNWAGRIASSLPTRLYECPNWNCEVVTFLPRRKLSLWESSLGATDIDTKEATPCE